jgi:hypothetical protein
MEKMANENVFGLNFNDIYRFRNVAEEEEYEYKEIQTIKYKQEMSFDQAYYEFISAIYYRLITSYFRDWDTGRVDFRDYPGIRTNGVLDNFNIVKQIKPLSNNPYHKWFLENFRNEFSIWDSVDHWNKGQGIDILESFIVENIVPFAKKYHPSVKILKTKNIITEVIQENEEIEIPVSIPVEKKKTGRPLGSKKQNTVEIFLPKHKIPVTEDKKLNIESLVLAIADIAWRKSLLYNNLLNQLVLSDNQIKYVSAMIFKESPMLENKYWQVVKKKSLYYIEPKIKRVGYYINSGILISSSEISEKTNIPKRTLCYRLNKMSVNDATKDWKDWK